MPVGVDDEGEVGIEEVGEDIGSDAENWGYRRHRTSPGHRPQSNLFSGHFLHELRGMSSTI